MHKKKIIIGAIILTVALIVWFFYLRNVMTLQKFQAESAYLEQYVMHHYLRSVVLYIMTYVVVTILFLPLPALLTILSGFLFGTFWGAVYTNIGATIGAACAFLLVRYLIGGWIQQRYEGQLKRFNAALRHGQISYLIGVHFITVIPFSVINILAGLTKVPFWNFVWTTSVGIFPGSLVYAFAGRQLRTIESVRDIFSYNIILAFSLLAMVAILPLIIRRFARYVRS